MQLAAHGPRASSSRYSRGHRKGSRTSPPPRDNAAMRELIAVAAFLAWPGGVQAQHEIHHSALADVVNLQAEASREVENDQLVAVLAAEAQGSNPAELAEAVNKKMAEALKLAREVPSVKARSGYYQTF